MLESLSTSLHMVTLEGELFDKSGSITGGNNQNSRLHLKGETDLAVLKQTSKSEKRADQMAQRFSQRAEFKLAGRKREGKQSQGRTGAA
ncbi:MAG: hypothetical protein R3D26_01110 [Cyanobacteriota/Melainabacteria group bacterium]